MIDGRRVIAVIPARGGSKGLPGKNIRELCGKPLIAWSIEQARCSEYVDAVVVSTDSEEIADVARVYGASIPFIRPVTLATDAASSVDVLLHLLGHFDERNDHYDFLVLLEPTSPLREVSDIDGALRALANREEAGSIVGVAKAEVTHPSFLYSIKAGLLHPFMGSQPTGLRRQDLVDDYYYLEGSVYASSIETFRSQRSFYHDNTLPWIVDRHKATEIDDLADFIVAEALLQARLDGVLFK